MKNKRKNRNGITLIALIITIVVLLILAGITIGILVSDRGVIKQATEAKDDNDSSSELEKVKMSVYSAMSEKDSAEKGILTTESINRGIEKQFGAGHFVTGNGPWEFKGPITKKIYSIAKDGEIEYALPKIGKGVKAKENSEYVSGDKKAVIPAGFMVSSTDDEDSIDGGLVIKDENENEFVWIPVDDINDMFGRTSDGKLVGKIYTNWNETDSEPLNWTESNGKITIIEANNYREPSIVSTYDEETSFSIIENILNIDIEDFDNYLQKEFKKMLDSVKKYKGFYIARYEMSKNEGKIYSIKGAISACGDEYAGNQWYGFFADQQLYTTKSVQSQMIWGCQYDQMMKWMQKNNIDVSSTSGCGAIMNTTTRNTGNFEGDKLNNIYDLLGNRYEWTVESYGTKFRTTRGGTKGYSSGFTEGPSKRETTEVYFRNATGPYGYNQHIGSRFTLYIK